MTNNEEQKSKLEAINTAVEQIKSKYGTGAIMKFGDARIAWHFPCQHLI